MRIITKYKNSSVQVRAALWYTVCNFIQKGISLIVVPIYVRLLTTAEYGEWSVFQSWRDILIIFASLNLYCGVFTKTLVDIKDDRDRYTSCMQGLGSVVTVFFLLIYFILKSPAERFFNLDMSTMILLFGYFLVFPSLQFWSTRQRVEYKYRSMVLVTLATFILTPLVSILLLLFTPLRTKAIIYGNLIISCGFGLFFYIYIFIKGKTFFDKKYWKYALKYNIPLIPHYLSLIVLGQADRIMIKNYCGDSDAGIYSFAYQIASVLNVLISAVNGSLVPWTYEQLRDKVYTQLRKVSNVLCILMGAITLLVALLSPEIVRILATSEYTQAIYVIPVVALGVYFTFSYNLFCNIEFYYGATKFVMIASCVGAVLNIVLNAIFIPVFGFIAAAYTTLVCYIVFMLMHFLFMRVILKKEEIKEQVFDLKSIFLISGIVTLVSFLGLLTFKNDIIRYCSLAVLIILGIIFRKKIIEIIKKLKS